MQTPVIHTGKAARTRTIPLSAPAAAALADLQALGAIGPFSTSTVRRAFIRAAARTRKPALTAVEAAPTAPDRTPPTRLLQLRTAPLRARQIEHSKPLVAQEPELVLEKTRKLRIRRRKKQLP